MDGNNYDGIVAAWKIELLNRRAKRWGFRRHELPDLQQEIILDLLAFRYDATRSNGATEETALTSLIDHRLKSILRAKRRYEERLELLQTSERHQAEYHQAEESERALDVREAIAGLPEREQRICQALLAGHTLNQIATDMGCSWPTLRRALARIRRRFCAAGLHGCLEV